MKNTLILIMGLTLSACTTIEINPVKETGVEGISTVILDGKQVVIFKDIDHLRLSHLNLKTGEFGVVDTQSMSGLTSLGQLVVPLEHTAYLVRNIATSQCKVVCPIKASPCISATLTNSKEVLTSGEDGMEELSAKESAPSDQQDHSRHSCPPIPAIHDVSCIGDIVVENNGLGNTSHPGGRQNSELTILEQALLKRFCGKPPR